MPHSTNEASFKLSEELDARLLTERFCNKVTKALYRNPSNPIGLVDDGQRPFLTSFLAKELAELEESLRLVLSCTSFNCAVRIPIQLPNFRSLASAYRASEF